MEYDLNKGFIKFQFIVRMTAAFILAVCFVYNFAHSILEQSGWDRLGYFFVAFFCFVPMMYNLILPLIAKLIVSPKRGRLIAYRVMMMLTYICDWLVALLILIDAVDKARKWGFNYIFRPFPILASVVILFDIVSAILTFNQKKRIETNLWGAY